MTGPVGALGQVALTTLQLLPQLLLPAGDGLLFWAVVAFIFWQAWRVASLERSLYGRVLNPPLRRTLTAAAFGLLAGAAGSLVLTLVGVPLGELDIAYIWPLALLLLLWNPRLLCFAYAGGVLCLSALLFGWPPIHVGGILGLVAVMHLVEGVLVALDGEKLVTPLWVRRPAQPARPGHPAEAETTVGGFLVQRFWPVPLVIVLFLPGAAAAGGVGMPGWWPLVSPVAGHPAADSLFALLPVAAALGYGDIALTRPAQRRSLATAGHLVLYSAILLGLAIAGSTYPVALWLGALFAPGAHEWLVRHGGHGEVHGDPAFTRPERGAAVLDVLPGTPAAELGLRSGDVVLSVGGQPVGGRRDLAAALESCGYFLSLDVDGPGGRRELEYARHRGGTLEFGIVPVPDPDDAAHADLSRRRRWPAVVEWLRRLRRPRNQP